VGPDGSRWLAGEPTGRTRLVVRTGPSVGRLVVPIGNCPEPIGDLRGEAASESLQDGVGGTDSQSRSRLDVERCNDAILDDHGIAL
jgi:hypothetical protein